MDRVRIKRKPEAAQYLGVSQNTLGRLSRTDPTFPRKLFISPGATGYAVDELDRWLDARPRIEPGERGIRGKSEPETT